MEKAPFISFLNHPPFLKEIVLFPIKNFTFCYFLGALPTDFPMPLSTPRPHKKLISSPILRFWLRSPFSRAGFFFFFPLSRKGTRSRGFQKGLPFWLFQPRSLFLSIWLAKPFCAFDNVSYPFSSCLNSVSLEKGGFFFDFSGFMITAPL